MELVLPKWNTRIFVESENGQILEKLMLNLPSFVSKIQKVHSAGAATEHSYRIALSELIGEMDKNVFVINEPKRIECGAPDLIVQFNGLTIGYLEQKDMGMNLRNFTGDNKRQQLRYLASLPNLVYTNCLDWDFYREGSLVASVNIGNLDFDKIQANPANYVELEYHLRDFMLHQPQPVSSPEELAKRLADKTKLVKDIISRSLESSESVNSELMAQYELVKKLLIHDVKIDEFADIYAETVAYGMLTARLHNRETSDFNRKTVANLLPKSNPFLRGLFTIISSDDLGDAISWVIEDLAEIFKVCNMENIMKGFGSLVGQSDPFLHFYETFLNHYNPNKRDSKGVWYTPEPVVKFIVRAVDEVLTKEFALDDGLADVSKIITEIQDKNENVHKVQILDPATGTGTFLAETIKQIALKVRAKAPSLWHDYIEKDLIPRIHGFELLMAPYAMCHVKLEMILQELGYVPSDSNSRLSVYLTNAIEKGEDWGETLGFANWLSKESKGANVIKQDLPIMCVIGNPPYNSEDGAAKDSWLIELMESYKSEPNSQMKLKEANPKAINDLYVKFVRTASHLIEKNGEGVMGFVTNHGYLDNLVFRGMRWHLLDTFDKIWILDLHGNSNKKEIGPDGLADKNVFDIRTGVAIIIAVKHKSSSNSLAKIWHGEISGARETKYSVLENESIYGKLFQEISPREPHYYFAKLDYGKMEQYNNGFCLSEFFPVNSIGVMTARDSFAVDFDYNKLSDRIKEFISLEVEDARSKFKLGKDTVEWRIQQVQLDIGEFDQSKVVKMCYRPFDNRWTYYTGHSRGVICRPRDNVMRNLLGGDNIALLSSRQQGTAGYHHVFVSNIIANDCVVSNVSKEANQVFPLYTYENYLGQTSKMINFNKAIHERLVEIATTQKNGQPEEMAIFDYIYGVLHCPDYREEYAEFLKTNFPRIPYPPDSQVFWDISSKGSQLRKLHLMEDMEIGNVSYQLSEGNNEIVKVSFRDNKIWINDGQYFENVPEVSWNFKIGSYRPAEKWLKDRKGTTLDFENTLHYSKILTILSETERIMNTISMPLRG